MNVICKMQRPFAVAAEAPEHPKHPKRIITYFCLCFQSNFISLT